MVNKHGGKVRLTFKLELDQVWIGTKERTEKINMNHIRQIVSEAIEGHEQYHIMVSLLPQFIFFVHTWQLVANFSYEEYKVNIFVSTVMMYLVHINVKSFSYLWSVNLICKYLFYCIK